MNKFFKYSGIITLLIFSFYYAFKINDVLIMQSSLMNSIKENKEIYNVLPVNAVIEDDYMIPGISGKSVNVLESYYNMIDYNVFNTNFLIYDLILPAVSISEYKDKYISSGNDSLRNIALIINDNSFILKYLNSNNISVSVLINYNEYISDSVNEQINNDLNNFDKLDNLLNNKICVINDNNLEICKKYKYYLIKPKIMIDNHNYLDVKNHLKSGQIIMISDLMNLDNFKSLYSELIFKGYNIVTIGELIRE